MSRDEIARWKVELSAVFHRICDEIRINDAIIDWIDIIFEQVGNARSCPSHSHTWFEFNYVLSGQMQTLFDHDSITIREGEFFLIPPGLTHAHVYTPGNPHEGICFRWRLRRSEGEEGPDDSSLYERLRGLTEWKPGGYRDRYGVGNLLSHFLQEAGSGKSPLSLQLLLVRLLETLTLIRDPDESASSDSAGSRDSLVKKVEVYLEDFQGDRLNVADLAASLHMSYGHLARLYKKRTGITLIERMNRIRLEKACELLGQPDLLIKEVAERSGFPDLSYFSKVFKRRYGVSPQAYRKYV
ncbi:helix-turn-helix domain-containing protein [Cohnella nanjingensis]|uniref:Helix-turn-helix domain-containing protein n=1 Tax=Cohnella nanjingensis TaxID=1387779 RepID=A0A7X0RRB1_9BACL|nr:helix-turn-helix domain-containing protein [Cohnella nanjingensis]MBB6672254.1 helix-turn-helix domain-containing protein [Cohnella nanjingensis]